MEKHALNTKDGLVLALLLAGCGGGESASKVIPDGSPRKAETRVLEAGAGMMQSAAPIRAFDIYLNGFHPMRDDPSVQMEAHHYCSQVNEDFAQCALFDGNTKDAKLNGIEYIVSERLFNTLPDAEKHYWHPHNYEILSGELAAPGLPSVARNRLMSQKINSYGKTWHVWMTDSHGKAVDALPLGEPHLAWSFNHDGEADAGMVRDRDARFGINSSNERRERRNLVSRARPQMGVNLLKDRFGGKTASK